jgi:hypothetical protein
MRGPVQEAIFNALAAYPSLSAEELVAKVYRGFNEPDWARTSIWVAIHKMRNKSLPFTIEPVYRCGWRYQLVFK